MQSNPQRVLKEKSLIWNLPLDSIDFAARLDQEDPLSSFRTLFSFPKKSELPSVKQTSNEECLYMCGQSLGLQPKSVPTYVADVLQTWATKGVHCHFSGNLPAAHCDLPPKGPMARLVGAKASEVVIMNGLTVNLHLMLCSFYRPTQHRYKIMIEDHAFSSDMGECLIREEDAIRLIEEEGDSIAVFVIPGIQYYTGQFFNIQTLTQVAHRKGITVGVDLAHAVGNVPLHLHDWDVDFAVWCTYKYLNSGAGGIGGAFVHDRWTNGVTTGLELPALKGWWGNAMTSKFSMKDEFEAAHGADMWKLSNPPPLLCATLMASLDIFSQTSMEEISRKQFLLTGYLEVLLKLYFSRSRPHHHNGHHSDMENSNVLSYIDDLPSIDILTPSDPKQRGSQLSISFSVPLCAVQEELKKNGVVCDVRKPCVLRVAPAPLYNSFCDVYKFVTLLVNVCRDLNGKIFSGDEVRAEEAFVDGEGCLPTSEDEDSNSSHDVDHMSVGRSNSSSSASSSSHAGNHSSSLSSSTSSDSETDSSVLNATLL